MSKKKAPRPKRERARQGHLDGMEPPHIAEIDETAEELYAVRQRRMALTEEERETADKLLELLHKHQLRTYEFDGLVVSISDVEKVKVKRKKEGGDDSGNEDG